MLSKTAQIVRPLWMADNSVRLLIEYGELTPEEVAEVVRLIKGGNVRSILASEADMQAIEENQT